MKREMSLCGATGWLIVGGLLCSVAPAPAEAGWIRAWGGNAANPDKIPPGDDFVAVAGGAYHSVALRENGSLVTWGLGVHDNTPEANDFVAIEAGYYFSVALRADGTLVGWGHGPPDPELPAEDGFVAILACEGHILVLKADASLRS